MHYNMSMANNDDFGIVVSTIKKIIFAVEEGDMINANIYMEKAQSIKPSEQQEFLEFQMLKNQGYYYLNSGNYITALKYLEKAKKLNEKSPKISQYTALLYLNIAEAYIQKYENLFYYK